MAKVPLYPYLIKHKIMPFPTRIFKFKFPKLIDDSGERFDDSGERFDDSGERFDDFGDFPNEI